jgi:hypothetical protein
VTCDYPSPFPFYSSAATAPSRFHRRWCRDEPGIRGAPQHSSVHPVIDDLNSGCPLGVLTAHSPRERDVAPVLRRCASQSRGSRSPCRSRERDGTLVEQTIDLRRLITCPPARTVPGDSSHAWCG